MDVKEGLFKICSSKRAKTDLNEASSTISMTAKRKVLDYEYGDEEADSIYASTATASNNKRKKGAVTKGQAAGVGQRKSARETKPKGNAGANLLQQAIGNKARMNKHHHPGLLDVHSDVHDIFAIHSPSSFSERVKRGGGGPASETYSFDQHSLLHFDLEHCATPLGGGSMGEFDPTMLGDADEHDNGVNGEIEGDYEDNLLLGKEARTRRCSSIGLHNASIAAFPLLMMKKNFENPSETFEELMPRSTRIRRKDNTFRVSINPGGNNNTYGGNALEVDRSQITAPPVASPVVQNMQLLHPGLANVATSSQQAGEAIPRSSTPNVDNLEGLNLLWYSCVDADHTFLGSHGAEALPVTQVVEHADVDPLSQSMIMQSPTHSVEWEGEADANGSSSNGTRKQRSSSI